MRLDIDELLDLQTPRTQSVLFLYSSQDPQHYFAMAASNTEAGPSEMFKQGLRIRREVLGDAYVDKALKGGMDPFAKPGQEYVTEVCWGSWGRPGLERKQRSLLNIGILMSLNRGPELRAHIRGTFLWIWFVLFLCD